MKLPLSWLRDYVELEASAEEIAERLTFSGTEVEGIRRIGAGCEGIVVGEVRAVDPHPRADRLHCCRVFDGQVERPVVCGASNVAVGARVALAPVGCRLPGGQTIRAAKLRGEPSEGMLCAEDELGLSDDHSGILLLPADAVPGSPLLDVLGGVETVLDLEITWNRADCLSIIGMARELAALYGLPLRVPAPQPAESAGEQAGAYATVRIDDPGACPRYTARVLTGCRPAPSPLWMQRRLAACGVRAISNLVDVTNYVMLECGQPLHAFDHRLLTGGQIIVRRAMPGETLETLDGQVRALTPGMLVIADAERPVAVAGIMGGAGSEIRESTRTVLLESAAFDPAVTHATAVALGLATESSHRFERGVDAAGAEWASRRAAALMLELAGGTLAAGVVDAYPRPAPPRRITCRFDRLNAVLGVAVDPDEACRTLERLQIPVVDREAGQVTVEAPSFRADLEIEADLVEEVARVHGLDSVPAARPTATVVPGADDVRPRVVLECRRVLAGLGLAEIMNYSFTSGALLEAFDPDGAGCRLVLPDPVAADHGVMRDALLPQLTETLGRNLARQSGEVACFEIGSVYGRDADGGSTEEQRLAIGLLGRPQGIGAPTRRKVTPEEMFLWVKGVVERLAGAQRAGEAVFSPVAHPCLEEGWSASVSLGGREAGIVGLLAPALRHRWRMQEPVGLAELRLDAVLTPAEGPPAFIGLAMFPAVERDLAAVVRDAVTHADVVRVIRAHAPPELTSIRLFDTFRAEEWGTERKSLAYTLVYRSNERTLTDDEVNAHQAAILDALRRELDAEIRES